MANDGVQTFLAFESTLYLGGNFTSVNGQTRNHLAALDLATGQLSSWNPNANGNVVAMTGNGGTVYVSGGFDHIGGRTRQWLAALSLDTGLADLWTPGPDGAPLSLAFAQNTVFAGGQFNYIGGKTRLNLAGLDARLDYNNALTWNPVSRGLVVDDSVIYTVRASSTTVYISGKARFGEDQRPYLAAYDLPPTLATPKLISKQSLQLNMAGARGKYYILQSSTNLVNWTPILTNFGPFTLLQDSSVSTNSRRFYRVVATQ